MTGAQAYQYAMAQLIEIEDSVDCLKKRAFTYDELYRLVSSRLSFIDGYIVALEHTGLIIKIEADALIGRVTNIRNWMRTVTPRFIPAFDKAVQL